MSHRREPIIYLARPRRVKGKRPCRCGLRFWTFRGYRAHYLREHVPADTPWG